MSRKNTLFSFLLLANLLAAGIVSGEEALFDGGPVELEDFVSRGGGRGGGAAMVRGERLAGGADWEIRGRSARLQENRAELSRIRILIKDRNGRRTSIVSPGCVYNRLTKEIKSDSTVCLVSRGIRITGIGYDLYLQEPERILVVRNTVHVVLHRNQLAGKENR